MRTLITSDLQKQHNRIRTSGAAAVGKPERLLTCKWRGSRTWGSIRIRYHKTW